MRSGNNFVRGTAPIGACRDGGFYLVLTAMLIFVIIVFGLLVIGIGFLTINKAKIQSVANSVAMAALSGYMNRTGTNDYSVRIQDGLANANAVLGANRPIGNSGTFGQLIITDGTTTAPADQSGELIFGKWYYEDPDGAGIGEDPCAANGYPCFIALPVPTGSDTTKVANGARVTIRNQNTNPIIAPFTNLLGYSGFVLRATATVTIVQRCTAFLMDVSYSTVAETHPPAILSPDPAVSDFEPPPRPPYTTKPGATVPYPSLYAFRKFPEFSDGVPVSACIPGVVTTKEEFYWCAMLNDSEYRNPSDLETTRHYITDYMLPEDTSGSADPAWEETTKDVDGNSVSILIDKFYNGSSHTGPEPFVTFLKAFNSTARKMAEEQVAGDRVMLVAFAGKIIPKIGSGGTSISGAVGPTTDLGLIAQLTNYMNLGLYGPPAAVGGSYAPYPGSSEIHPNFLDMGMVPLNVPATENEFQANTHLAQALYETSVVLQDCPAGANKSIIVATDGLATCRYGEFGDSPTPFDVNGTSRCSNTYSTYMAAEAQMMAPTTGIIARLKDEGIGVTTLVRGSLVEPHILNIKPAGSDHFLDFLEAVGMQYGGLNDPSGNMNIVSIHHPDYPTVSDADSFTNPPFHRALGLLVELSAQTGGIYCPLLDPGNFFEYDPNGKLMDSVRSVGAPEYRSIYNLSVPEQAVDCALRAVGTDNPYVLVEED